MLRNALVRRIQQIPVLRSLHRLFIICILILKRVMNTFKDVQTIYNFKINFVKNFLYQKQLAKLKFEMCFPLGRYEYKRFFCKILNSSFRLVLNV